MVLNFPTVMLPLFIALCAWLLLRLLSALLGRRSLLASPPDLLLLMLHLLMLLLFRLGRCGCPVSRLLLDVLADYRITRLVTVAPAA